MFDFNQPIINLAYDVLLARGFLVELKNEKLYLSDNAALKDVTTGEMYISEMSGISDLKFLKYVLEKFTIGYVNINSDEREILINSMSYEQTKQLFGYGNRITSSSEFSYRDISGWNRFSRHLTGLKIPVVVLLELSRDRLVTVQQWTVLNLFFCQIYGDELLFFIYVYQRIRGN